MRRPVGEQRLGLAAEQCGHRADLGEGAESARSRLQRRRWRRRPGQRLQQVVGRQDLAKTHGVAAGQVGVRLLGGGAESADHVVGAGVGRPTQDRAGLVRGEIDS